MYCSTHLPALEDPLPSGCSGPPGTNHIRQVKCDHTPDSPIHSFETCIPTLMACSQPETEGFTRAHTSHCAPPDGACSGDKRSQTSSEAPADSNSLSCWGGPAVNRLWGLRDMVTMVEAPMGNVGFCLCLSICQ